MIDTDVFRYERRYFATDLLEDLVDRVMPPHVVQEAKPINVHGGNERPAQVGVFLKGSLVRKPRQRIRQQGMLCLSLSKVSHATTTVPAILGDRLVLVPAVIVPAVDRLRLGRLVLGDDLLERVGVDEVSLFAVDRGGQHQLAVPALDTGDLDLSVWSVPGASDVRLERLPLGHKVAPAGKEVLGLGHAVERGRRRTAVRISVDGVELVARTGRQLDRVPVPILLGVDGLAA